MRKLTLLLLVFSLFIMQLKAFEPLGRQLRPLPKQKYERIFNAFHTREKVPIKLLHRGLFAEQTTVRAYSASLLGDHGDRTSVLYLIDALSDQTRHVGARYAEQGMYTTRYWANESLKKLTGEDFSFIWDDSDEKRNKSIQRWREWYQKATKPSLKSCHAAPNDKELHNCPLGLSCCYFESLPFKLPAMFLENV